MSGLISLFRMGEAKPSTIYTSQDKGIIIANLSD